MASVSFPSSTCCAFWRWPIADSTFTSNDSIVGLPSSLGLSASTKTSESNTFGPFSTTSSSVSKMGSLVSFPSFPWSFSHRCSTNISTWSDAGLFSTTTGASSSKNSSVWSPSVDSSPFCFEDESSIAVSIFKRNDSTVASPPSLDSSSVLSFEIKISESW